MNADETSTTEVPLVRNGAPTLHLVAHPGRAEETRIRCRRVVTLIGSHSDCKVTLQHKRVSPVHLAIVNDGSRILAVDLVARHTPLLNGLKMEHECVRTGDVLSVQPWEFRVEVETPNRHEDGGPVDLEPTPQIVAFEHEATGRLLRPNRDLCVIGRRSGCDIALTDHRVSRVHALLLNYFGRPAVCDLLSLNGTFVNQTPVRFAALKHDDVLTLGDTSFRVRFVGCPVAKHAGKEPAIPDPPVETEEEEHGPDLIDIEETESAHNWRIADSLEKVARKARSRVS